MPALQAAELQGRLCLPGILCLLELSLERQPAAPRLLLACSAGREAACRGQVRPTHCCGARTCGQRVSGRSKCLLALLQLAAEPLAPALLSPQLALQPGRLLVGLRLLPRCLPDLLGQRVGASLLVAHLRQGQISIPRQRLIARVQGLNATWLCRALILPSCSASSWASLSRSTVPKSGSSPAISRRLARPGPGRPPAAPWPLRSPSVLKQLNAQQDRAR